MEHIKYHLESTAGQLWLAFISLVLAVVALVMPLRAEISSLEAQFKTKSDDLVWMINSAAKIKNSDGYKIIKRPISLLQELSKKHQLKNSLTRATERGETTTVEYEHAKFKNVASLIYEYESISHNTITSFSVSESKDSTPGYVDVVLSVNAK